MAENRPVLWLTYSWLDDEQQDVQYVAQELQRSGVDVRLDKWHLKAGERLWDQIASAISDESECDGWAIYATRNSLESQACKEEFAYALNRALQTRGSSFPIIAIFPEEYDGSLIHASLQVRLAVLLSDEEWCERVLAALESRSPNIIIPDIAAYFIEVHPATMEVNRFAYVIELRPRIGTWQPFNVMFPEAEEDRVKPLLMYGVKDAPTLRSMLHLPYRGIDTTGEFCMLGADNPATPTTSYYLWCAELPSMIAFGIGPKFYSLTLRNSSDSSRTME